MSINDITGDHIRSKANSRAYQDNWELIYGCQHQHQDPALTQDAQPSAPQASVISISTMDGSGTKQARPAHSADTVASGARSETEQ